MLKAAVEGRLVPTEAELARQEGREFESGTELLARIGRTANLRSAIDGWSSANIESLVAPSRKCAYGVLQPGDDVERGVPMVRVGDISEGRVSLSDLKHIDPGIAASYPRTKLEGGEVLITLVGAIGRSAVVPPALQGANVARAVGVIPLHSEINSEWVELWLRNPSQIATMDGKAHEVARKTLNLEDVRSTTVEIPPRSEQDRITAEASRILALAEHQGRLFSDSQKRCLRMRKAILQRAFAGTLG